MPELIPFKAPAALNRALRPLREYARSTVAWHRTAEGLPDDSISVLIALAGHADACEGYHEDGRWYFPGGMLVKARVYAWANLPDAPAFGKGRCG